MFEYSHGAELVDPDLESIKCYLLDYLKNTGVSSIELDSISEDEADTESILEIFEKYPQITAEIPPFSSLMTFLLSNASKRLLTQLYPKEILDISTIRNILEKKISILELGGNNTIFDYAWSSLSNEERESIEAFRHKNYFRSLLLSNLKNFPFIIENLPEDIREVFEEESNIDQANLFIGTDLVMQIEEFIKNKDAKSAIKAFTKMKEEAILYNTILIAKFVLMFSHDNSLNLLRSIPRYEEIFNQLLEIAKFELAALVYPKFFEEYAFENGAKFAHIVMQNDYKLFLDNIAVFKLDSNLRKEIYKREKSIKFYLSVAEYFDYYEKAEEEISSLEGFSLKDKIKRLNTIENTLEILG